MASVLAFDASSTTGWASFANARVKPVLGDIELPSGPDHGARNAFMFASARELIKAHRPEWVAFESPVFYPRDRWHTRRLLVGLVDAIELAATMAGCRRLEVLPTLAKECLSGDSRADKDAMLLAAINMGWTVASHHQADACGIALATFNHIRHAVAA